MRPEALGVRWHFGRTPASTVFRVRLLVGVDTAPKYIGLSRSKGETAQAVTKFLWIFVPIDRLK